MPSDAPLIRRARATEADQVGAAGFYERHGFEPVEETGGDNEEGQPDVRYVFTPLSA